MKTKTEMELLMDMGEAFNEFKDANNKRVDGIEEKLANYAELQAQMEDLEAQTRRPNLGGGSIISGGGGWESGVRGRASQEELKLIRSLVRGDSGGISNAMSVGSDPDGGYSVLPFTESGIGQILRDVSTLRPFADIKTLPTGDSYEELLSVDGAQADWVGETSARPATTQPELKKFSVPLREIYSMPVATQRLLDDSSEDIQAWLVDQVGVAFAEKENTAFVLGDGVLRPRGFLTYPTETADDGSRTDWPVLQHVVSGAAGGFAASDPGDALFDLVSKLKSGYRRSATWFMNRATENSVRKFKDGQGDYLWTQSLQAGVPNVLLGFPVILNEDMPDVAADALPIALADWSRGYRIVDRPGLKILPDPYTNKPNVNIYVYGRVGGDVRDFNAVKLLKIST